MYISFFHQNSICSAYIVDYSKIVNTITIYILDFNSELGYEIIFKKEETAIWNTNESIKIKFPLTFYSLCEKLSEVFPGNAFPGINQIQKEEFAA
jgi:hypothetical protein